MKHLTTIALILNIAIAGGYAQPPAANAHQRSVQMPFSGTGSSSTIDLKHPNTTTGEENLAGTGPLGTFVFRMVKAAANAPLANSACSAAFFPNVAGAGVFSFADGSLLTVTLTQGGDCIDFAQMVAHCTLTFKITGGSGRFKNASGVLTLSETSLPVLADLSGLPVLFSEAGEFTGTISGVATDDAQDGRR